MDGTRPAKRILVLDDEPVILELLEGYLRSHNFDSFATSLWTEALEEITRNPPDLILLDLQMPRVQGPSILKYIREGGWNMPVIIVSAFVSPENVEELKRLGVTDFVSKPFRLRTVAESINRALDLSPDSPAPSLPAAGRTSGRPVAEMHPRHPGPPDLGIPPAQPKPPLSPAPFTPQDTVSVSRSVSSRRAPRQRLWNTKTIYLYLAIALFCLLLVLFG